jgi:hypothetical protein
MAEKTEKNGSNVGYFLVGLAFCWVSQERSPNTAIALSLVLVSYPVISIHSLLRGESVGRACGIKGWKRNPERRFSFAVSRELASI